MKMFFVWSSLSKGRRACRIDRPLSTTASPKIPQEITINPMKNSGEKWEFLSPPQLLLETFLPETSTGNSGKLFGLMICSNKEVKLKFVFLEDKSKYRIDT